jgi:excisionase family DNA binding protein
MRTIDNAIALSVEQAAAATSLGASTLRKYIDDNQLKVCTVGDRKVILRDDLLDFLRSNPKLPR